MIHLPLVYLLHHHQPEDVYKIDLNMNVSKLKCFCLIHITACFIRLCRCIPGAIPVLHGDRRDASFLHGAGSGPVQPRGGRRRLEDLSHI